MTGSSAFERHHEAKSNGTVSFCRKRGGRSHGRLVPGVSLPGPAASTLRRPAGGPGPGLARRNSRGTGRPVRCALGPGGKGQAFSGGQSGACGLVISLLGCI